MKIWKHKNIQISKCTTIHVEKYKYKKCKRVSKSKYM